MLTSKQQIDRLLRPGSTYFNLNPFEVLQLEHLTPVEAIKKKYKRLSILVHPDKNQEDVERAQAAFEIINRAWKILENDVTRKKCLTIYEEAKERTDLQISEKRKKLKKEGRSNEKIPEDEPEKYKRATFVMVTKLFADVIPNSFYGSAVNNIIFFRWRENVSSLKFAIWKSAKESAKKKLKRKRQSKLTRNLPRTLKNQDKSE